MSVLVSAQSLSEAWVRTLALVRKAPHGRRVHVVTTVLAPDLELHDMRGLLDKVLANAGSQSVDTVAQTIFPSALYSPPAFSWHPDLAPEAVAELDTAADSLYDTYAELLPLLKTVHANKSGTYFSRMTTWPGKEAGGTNQLRLRIAGLRREALNGRRTNNTLDIDVAADGLETDVRGVQVYAPTDKRTRGFPCLTHIDLTLLDGQLHATAVYRHQYLMEKAYGNLVGLGAVLQFLCQQGGCQLGELVVHATLADAQPGAFADDVDTLIRDGLAIVEKSRQA